MRKELLRVFRKWFVPLALGALLFAFWAETAAPQTTGRIRGHVMSAETGKAIPGVNVVVKRTTMGAATDFEGRFAISRVPPGTYTLVFSAVGYGVVERADVRVSAGQVTDVDADLEEETIQMGDVMVTAASLRPERVTDAPAAVTVLSAREIELESKQGQLPRVLETQPGVDIVQSGVYDFNVNARGFNSTLNRRVLVLMDGRDLAIPLLSVQEWTSVPIPAEDIKRLEFVRGPGSALYGANAYNGVINIVSASPREVLGTRVTVGGGELSSIRADVRHAGASGPWSYKLNLGRQQSDTWTEDRTSAVEYSGLSLERRALNTDKIATNYGSARLDRDFLDGSALTFEGGWVQVENEVFVTGIGRVQVGKTNKPWGRVNYGSQRFNAQVWATARNSSDSDRNFSLASGIPIDDKSYNVYAEFQHNLSAVEGRFRFIWGVSQRFRNTDTQGTLFSKVQDDNFTGVFAQAEYKFSDQFKAVAAARVDRSSLHDTQVSPKGAIVWTPTASHSFRGTFNRAFQVPNYSEFDLNVLADIAPLNLLEFLIEQQVAASLGVPSIDLPLNFSAQTPVLALGNTDLDVETITGFEVGYKGILGKKLFVTVDAYYNQLQDFVTDLLMGVNQSLPTYQLPDLSTVLPPPAVAPTEAAILGAISANVPGLGTLTEAQTVAGIGTLPAGTNAIFISYANAGEVNEYGGEISVNYYVTDEVLLGANYAYFKFEVKDQQVGDVLLPNAPQNKGSVGISYFGKQGLNASLKLRLVEEFRWAAGVFEGKIPGYGIVNVSAGYQVHDNVKVGFTVTNLLDKEHFEVFGGSVNGRRAFGNLAVTF